MPYWYDKDKEEPEYNPPRYNGILTKEKLKNATPNSKGKYQLGELKQDYRNEHLGTIPAGTRGLYRWPDGATNTRHIEFECPRIPTFMMAVKKVHIRVTVLTDTVKSLGFVDIPET